MFIAVVMQSFRTSDKTGPIPPPFPYVLIVTDNSRGGFEGEGRTGHGGPSDSDIHSSLMAGPICPDSPSPLPL